MSGAQVASPFPIRPPALLLPRSLVLQGIEGYPSFRARECRSAGYPLDLSHTAVLTPPSSDEGDNSSDDDAKVDVASHTSGESEHGHRPWKHQRRNSDLTELLHRPRIEPPIATMKQLVIKMGESEDLFDIWGCLDIDEWLRPDWAKIWDSFDFSEDPMIHAEVAFAHQPRDVQIMAALLALDEETGLHSYQAKWDRWCEVGPEGQACLGQRGWDIMLGFWATHPAAVIKYIHDRNLREPFPWLDLGFTHFAPGWHQTLELDGRVWDTHFPGKGTAGKWEDYYAAIHYKGRGLFNTRIPFPRRIYQSDKELFGAVWAGSAMGHPVSHLDLARKFMENSGYAAFGDIAFRAALFVNMVRRIGYKTIRAEPIHPLQQP